MRPHSDQPPLQATSHARPLSTGDHVLPAVILTETGEGPLTSASGQNCDWS